MKRKTNVLFYFLTGYVFMQFMWWAYQLIQLNLTLDNSAENERRIIAMIVGEGSVFILILGVGLFQIRKAIQKELELSIRQSNFLLSITHELKTPIASNKLAFQTLLRRNLEQETKEILLKNALFESERLEILIENLLNASRIENKALQPLFELVNINELIKSLVQNIKKLHSNRIIHCNFKTEQNISVDKFMMNMVLNNLIENAIKYSSADSTIEINVNKSAKNLIIEIKDFGIGISPSDALLIFNKFYRAGDENTRQKQGSGLGLYISNEFVIMHRGRIEYSSNEPRGSIFKIVLPI